MIPISLADVATAVGGRLDGVPDPGLPATAAPRVTAGSTVSAATRVTAATPVTAVTADSRDVSPGALFVAIPGERVDGHDFAAAAVAGGAVAVLATRPVGVPAVLVDPAGGIVPALGALARELRDRSAAAVVGVTGSSGKTSTKDLLAGVLGRLGPVVAAPGSYNNDIGLPLTVLRVEPDTRAVVLEMGARGEGHIARLCRIARPDIGVVLNVGSAHVGEYPDGRAGVARAKGELAAAADRLVVLNADDPAVAAMAGRAHAPVVTFGASAAADVRARDVRVGRDGRAAYTLVAAGAREPVTLRLVGAHHVPNSLAAAAVALELGLAAADVAAALSAAEPRSRWRMEVHDRADGVTVVNDAYNANPESVRAALEALAAMSTDRRSVAVLGEMAELGAAAAGAHVEVGGLADRLGVDLLVAVGAAARGIHTGAAGGTTEAVRVADADAALALLRDRVRPGDVVLVKGSRVAGLERVAAGLLADVPVGIA